MLQSGSDTFRGWQHPLESARQHFDRGQYREAASLFKQVLGDAPNHAESLHRLGFIANRLGMHQRAIRLMRHALRCGGQSPDLLNDLGSVFVRVQDFDNAGRCFTRCIDHYPASSLGYVSLAYLRNRDGDFQGARKLYRQAIQRADQTFEAEFNLATLYREWGHLDDAVAVYQSLIDRHPDQSVLLDGRGRSRLQLKQWKQGWPDYEARLRVPDEPAKINLRLPIQRWNGTSLRNKHVLVLHEQGIGDEVQFASCYPDLIAAADRCTITCSPRLLSVFQRSFPAARFVAVEASQREHWSPTCRTDFDYVIPAGSLPGQFRNHDDDFPGSPFLIPRSPRTRSLRSRSDQQPRLRVGVSWCGGAVDDQIARRSVPWQIFRRLLEVQDVDFISLQHGLAGVDSRDAVKADTRLQSSDIDAYRELEPWFDLMVSLDLLISVDNSNVHFAGALGVPTWLLLPNHPNWRWPLDRQTCSWYRYVRLIHKHEHGRWDGVIEEVKRRLSVVTGCNSPSDHRSGLLRESA